MMARWVLVALLLCVSMGGVACPLCLGAYQSSKADQLVVLARAVLVVPAGNGYRVVEVIKGSSPASGVIDASAVQLKVAPAGHGTPLLLVSDDAWPMWVSVGEIGAEHARWLRIIASGKRGTAMNADEWRERVALMLPYLEQSRAAGRRDRVRRALGCALRRVACGQVAYRRTRGPALAWRAGACVAAIALSAAIGDRGRCEGRRKTRIADRRRVAGGRRDQSGIVHRGRSAAAWTGARWRGSTSITSAIATRNTGDRGGAACA